MKIRWPYYVISSLILLIISVLILWWYIATNETRKYARDVYKLELYSQRQQLEIEIMEQTSALSKMKREVRRIKPVYQSEKGQQ